jgi:small subunit ribosomal protein S1
MTKETKKKSEETEEVVTPAEIITSDETEEEIVETEDDEEEIIEDEEEIKLRKVSSLEMAEFDWNTYDKRGKTINKDDKAKYEAMYEKTLSSINQNQVIDGVVISMNSREVVINIGFKSEGVVSLNEFRYNPELKVGDTVEVYIESQEDKKGQLLLSHKKARALRSWDRVNAAHNNDEIVKGFIKCRTKGGMIVDVFGIEAFLPGSQIGRASCRERVSNFV